MTTTIVPGLGQGVVFTSQGAGASPGYDAVDVRRADSQGLQEGVVGASDFMVVQRGAGANMSVDIGMPAGGFAMVQGDTVNGQGLYTVPVHSATVNETIATADATNPRIDQVILEIQDNVHDASGGNLARTRILTGTPTAGATLTNRNGAAALPGSALLLADVLVGAAASSITNSVIRDRRKWARGINNRLIRTSGDFTFTNTTMAELDTTNLKARFECSGAPVLLTVSCMMKVTVAAILSAGLFMDGAALSSTGALGQVVVATTGQFHGISFHYVALPSAGSHQFGVSGATNGGTATAGGSATNPFLFTVREIVAQDSANNTTTTG